MFCSCISFIFKAVNGISRPAQDELLRCSKVGLQEVQPGDCEAYSFIWFGLRASGRCKERHVHKKSLQETHVDDIC